MIKLATLVDTRLPRVSPQAGYNFRLGGFSGADFDSTGIRYYNHIDELETGEVREHFLTFPFSVAPITEGRKVVYRKGIYTIEFEMVDKKTIKSTIILTGKPPVNQIVFPHSLKTGFQSSFDTTKKEIDIRKAGSSRPWLTFLKLTSDRGVLSYSWSSGQLTIDIPQAVADTISPANPLVIDPTTVDSDGQGTGHPIIGTCVTVDSSGNVYCVWLEDDGAASIVKIAKYNAALDTLLSGPHDLVKTSGGIIENVVRAIYVAIYINTAETPARLHLAYSEGSVACRYSKCVDLTALGTAANWKNANEQSAGGETTGMSAAYVPSMVVTAAGKIYITTSNAAIYVKSHPGAGVGNVWSAQTTITNANPTAVPSMARDSSGYLYITERRLDAGADYSATFYKSTNVDDITAWSSSVFVINPTAGEEIMDIQTIAVSGTQIIVVGHNRSTAQIWYNRSNDNGAIWSQGTGEPSGALVVSDAGVTNAPHQNLAIDGAGAVYLFYQDATNFDYKYVKYSGGAWGAENLIYAHVATPDFCITCQKDPPSTATKLYFMFRDTDAATDDLFIDSITVEAAAAEALPLARRHGLAAQLGKGRV